MNRPACIAAAILLVLAGSAAPQESRDRESPFPRLPDGRSMQEEILKAEHERSLKDAAQLIELSEQLKQELEKNERHVLSIAAIKKTEEIEKIAKRIRSRMRKF